MENIDFNSCPIGIRNIEKINNTNDRMELLMERLEEKMDTMKEDITSLSKDMNEQVMSINQRLDKVEHKLDNFKMSIPETVNTEIKRMNSDGAYKLIKWIVTVLCSSVVITVLTRFILTLLHL